MILNLFPLTLVERVVPYSMAHTPRVIRLSKDFGCGSRCLTLSLASFSFSFLLVFTSSLISQDCSSHSTTSTNPLVTFPSASPSRFWSVSTPLRAQSPLTSPAMASTSLPPPPNGKDAEGTLNHSFPFQSLYSLHSQSQVDLLRLPTPEPSISDSPFLPFFPF